MRCQAYRLCLLAEPHGGTGPVLAGPAGAALVRQGEHGDPAVRPAAQVGVGVLLLEQAEDVGGPGSA